MTVYVITNDRYSNQSDEVTFDELVAMCEECFPESTTELKERGGKVYDERGEVVAIEKSAYDAE